MVNNSLNDNSVISVGENVLQIQNVSLEKSDIGMIRIFAYGFLADHKINTVQLGQAGKILINHTAVACVQHTPSGGEPLI